jgi:hypothetical protein
VANKPGGETRHADGIVEVREVYRLVASGDLGEEEAFARLREIRTPIPNETVALIDHLRALSPTDVGAVFRALHDMQALLGRAPDDETVVRLFERINVSGPVSVGTHGFGF